MIASVAAALPGWGGSQPLDPRRSLFQDTAMRFPTMRPVAHRKLARPLPCALLTHDIASPSAGSEQCAIASDGLLDRHSDSRVRLGGVITFRTLQARAVATPTCSSQEIDSPACQPGCRVVQ